ncbi:GAF domain-containing SpoIIE family protein phosphatase [Leifsonia sp. WHRI 6310E]|uniref:PP2C family protein-serine/threonine phosphatase n=1 Tax=Leifsonia sp. WHRI 6310E TaxID=3162562 RepID=UPI0032EB8F64
MTTGGRMTIEAVGTLETELRRQSAVEALEILDTAPEDRFDRITRMAQQLFGVPMVSITLLDDDRQWRKSHLGLTREAPRADSFCDLTVRTDSPVIIGDTTADDRFRDNPFVAGDPHLRFYAGEPIHAPGGEAVGTLCVVDTEPRTLTGGEQRLLRDLADWVQAELDRDEELDRTAVVQRALLPRRKPAARGYDVAAACEPGERIAGDFYDWYDTDGGFTVTVGDVVGTGSPIAIIAASVRAALRSATTFAELEPAVAEASRMIEEELDRLAAYTSVFHARIDGDGLVRFVDAGHGLAFVVRATGDIERLETSTLPLGIAGERPEHSVSLGAGEALLVISDAVFDALGGEAGLGVLQSRVRGSATSAGAVSRIVGAARDEHGAAPVGDALAILVRRD